MVHEELPSDLIVGVIQIVIERQRPREYSVSFLEEFENKARYSFYIHLLPERRLIDREVSPPCTGPGNGHGGTP